MTFGPRSWRYAAFACLALIVLSPYLTTGYYFDDAGNSLLTSSLKLRGQGFWDFIALQNRSWMLESGRFYPLSLPLAYGTWYLIPSLLAYRLLEVSFTVVDLFIFLALVARLCGDRRTALLSGLAVLSLFQLRNYHDPISSYVSLMQISLALGLGAMLLLLRYRDTLRAWTLGASLLLYAATLLLYETALCFLPPLVFLAFQPMAATGAKKKGTKLLARWGHLGLTAVYLGVVFCLRFHTQPAYTGMRSSLGVGALSAFSKQLSGAFPLIYAFFGRSDFYSFGTLLSREFLTPGLLAVFVLGAAFYYVTQTSEQVSDERDRAEPLRFGSSILGWSLLLIPSALISLSAKYQDDLGRPGMAYLPVYLSYFGLALLITRALTRKAGRPKMRAAIFGALLAFSYSTNWIAASHLNAYWKNSRELVQAAFEKGLLSEVEPQALLLRTRTQTWDWARPDFIFSSSGKTNPIGDLENELSKQPPPAGQKTYAVLEDIQGPGHGRVMLVLIEHADWDAEHKKVTRIHTSAPVKVIDFENYAAHLSQSDAREFALP